MAKFVPKYIEEKDNVNISKVHPLKTFSKSMVGLFTILFFIYIFLRITVETLIAFIPQRLDNEIAQMFASQIKSSEEYELSRVIIQKKLDDLVILSRLGDRKFRISVIDSSDINAFAMPGNNIVITSSLIKEIDTENELVYILSHELGHFISNDHLRAMGNSLVYIGITVFLSATINSNLSDFIANNINFFNLKYSRSQEKFADKFAIDLLLRKYGHVSGASDILTKITNDASQQKIEKMPFIEIASTHPLTRKRFAYIKKRIDTDGLKLLDQVPLDLRIDCESVR